MSFDIRCSNCGAPSSTSVGVCPFCKTPFVNSKSKSKASSENPLLANIKKDFRDGKLDQVLFTCDLIFKNPKKQKLRENPNFLKTYLKALIESDGPPSLIRTLVSHLLQIDPSDQDATDYLDLLDARDELSHEKNDPGEIKLKALIRRSPENPYPYFYLGAHLFWIDQDYSQAIIYLERAVEKHPNFVRAWGCIGAIYKKLGNQTLSKRAFSQAAQVETNSKMKKFFRSMTKSET